MKKILFTFMLLLWVAVGMAQTYINVGTLDELRAALKDPNAKIKLTADIDISSLKDENAPLCSTFAGIIDGSYTEQVGDSTVYDSHKIYGGINEYETVINEKGIEVKKVKARNFTTYSHSPLFDNLNHATIMNVAFCNMQVSSDKSEVGVLASRAVNQCKFTNVVMDYCDTFCDNDRGGVLFGYAEYCTFQLVSLKRCVVYVNGVEGGGLVGHSDHCTYEVCTTSFDSGVFADGTDYWFGKGENAARCGGLVGYSVYDKFTGCINGAVVGADQSQVGGFAGVSKYTNFNNCINVGVVAHIDKDDFNNLRNRRNKKLDDLEMTPAELGWTVGGSTVGAIAIPTIIGVMVSENFNYWVYANWPTLLDLRFMKMSWDWCWSLGIQYPIWSGQLAAATIVLAVVAAAIAITIQLEGGDDEVGGISGLAQGGTFELCQNYGELKCRDDNLGGIVGLGQGVTINNCFNSGDLIRNEDDVTGTILGKAEPNKDDNNKKCKVTNCLSTNAYHIVGDEDYEDGMDPASGNNYRPDGEKYNGDRVRCEEPVARELINSGLVSWWLNQGIENRSIGAKPWRQGIAENTKNFNVMDPSHPEVEIKDLDPYEISTPDELRNFATQVAVGNKFAVGVLTADIDMSEYPFPWIPIGIGENNSFRGIFDGQGHTISGIDCTTDADMGAALFGVVHTGADIRNVTVKNSKFSHANDYGAAGIVGRVSFSWWGNVVIENCASYADVDARIHAGGIVGLMSAEDVPNVNVYVDNCYNGGTITAEDGNSGLLCGYVSNHGHVSNSWSDGQLRNGSKKDIWPYSIVNDKDNPVAECLVGYGTSLDIQNCYIVNPKDNVDRYEECKEQYPLQAGVEIVSDEELANGRFTRKLNGYTNDVTKSLSWQQNLGTDAYPVLGNKGVYYTRTVSNQYGTLCLPYALKSDDNIRYYYFDESSDDNGEVTLNFTYAPLVIPGSPVLFSVAEPGDITFSDANIANIGWADSPVASYPATTWDFTGTYEQRIFEDDATKTIYYVSKDAIRHSSNSVTIAPYRAYFVGPSIESLTGNGPSQAKIRIVLDDEDGESSSIQFIHSELAPSFSNSKTYSLLGTEVGKDYRGLVIRNGKKVFQNK